MTARSGILFVIASPSGGGKSTLCRRLLGLVPQLDFSISWTTRAPRPGEQDGVEYHFTDEPRFRQKIASGDFLEWAEVHGRLYGTDRREIADGTRAGHDLLLDIDVQGAEQVRRSGWPGVSIFVLPPDRATLAERLRARGTEGEASIARRLDAARREISRWSEFDYVVVNDELDRATATLAAIVVACRHARVPMEATARRITSTFEGGTP